MQAFLSLGVWGSWEGVGRHGREPWIMWADGSSLASSLDLTLFPA